MSGERGPLFANPANYRAWVGFSTDYREDLEANVNFTRTGDAVDGRGYNTSVGLGWAQNSRMSHGLSLGHLSDEPLVAVGKGDNRRRCARSLGVWDDDGLARLNHRNTRVGGTQVDSDYL